LNELEAARTVNEKCVELDIPLKNPEAGLPEIKPEVRFISNKMKVKLASKLHIRQNKNKNKEFKANIHRAENFVSRPKKNQKVGPFFSKMC
jgi:hypothetical protein